MTKFRIKPIAACCGLWLATVAVVQAQPQSPPQRPIAPPTRLQPPGALPRPGAAPGVQPPLDHASEQAVRGAVRSYLLTPAGDVSGLLLEDGTQVDVPPHLSAQLIDGVHLHDRVEVDGMRAPGSPVMRAAQITDVATSKVVRVDGPPLALPPERAAVAPALTPMTENSRIVAMLYTPRGDVGGVLTKDGTQVHFPPQAEVGQALAVGRPFYARGFGTQGLHGRAMEATAVGTSAGDAQAVFSPPAARPGLPPVRRGPAPEGVPPPVDGGPTGAAPSAPVGMPTPPQPVDAPPASSR